VAKESDIGFLATSYSYPEKHNHVAGFDTHWKINKQTNFSGQILGSTSRNYFYDALIDDSKYKTGNGISYTYGYEYESKNFGYNFGGDGTTKNFHTDLGFTSQTNIMSNYASANIRSDPAPKKTIIRKSLGASFGYRNNFSGRLQGWGADVNGNLGLKNSASIGSGFSFGREKIYEDEFGPVRNAVREGAFFGAPEREALQYGSFTYFFKRFNKRVSMNSNLSMSFNSFDYDFGAGRDYPRVSPAAIALGQDAPLDPGPAKSMYYGIGASFKPTDNFDFYVSYNRSSLRRNATHLLAYESNNFSFSSTYQFSRFVNVKARIYYNTLSDRVFGQYTFAWTPSVGKALYIGYNDNSTYKGYAFGHQQDGLLQLNRTFFIKMTYLFRKSF